MAASLVDWHLARRIARSLAGGDAEVAGVDAALARRVGLEGLDRVLGYTGLDPAAAIPAMETVSRREWIESNLAELRELAAPLEERALREIDLPGPLDGVVRRGLGAAGGVEAGVVLGYGSRRVLGQYQVSLARAERPPRMLLVGENVAHAAAEMGADRERFLLWVAVHEQTHSVQFAAVPWLREHVAGFLERVIATASGRIDVGALAALARRIVTTDPRRAMREALRGELTRALAGPEQAAVLDELQATMAVIEGYAEHVMDAASADDPGLASMRARMDERRERRGGLGDVVARALGLGMKLRQYELGKAWCDAVAADAGIEGLNRVWESPEALPTLAELEETAFSQAPA
jgi:coenzyme F420 biosynthesis associated uncharacterized protein